MRASAVLFALVLLIPAALPAARANDPPVVLSVEGISDGMVGNPLEASVTASDPEGGNLTFEWSVDGRVVALGPDLTYYLMPGPKNVTLVVRDMDGGKTVLSWTVTGDLPPGSDEVPDNDANRRMFWTIFGSAGAVLAAALAWSLFRKDGPDQRSNIERKRP